MEIQNILEITPILQKKKQIKLKHPIFYMFYLISAYLHDIFLWTFLNNLGNKIFPTKIEVQKRNDHEPMHIS